MAGYVCSVGSAKGGVGKTTTAINVGASLAENGHEVVVVDGDLKMPNVGRTLGIETETGIHTVLSGDATVDDVLVETEWPNLWALPGESGLDAYANTDPSEMGRVIRDLRAEFDAVLVDTGSGLTDETTVALGVADGVLCLSKPSSWSVTDAKKTLELVDRAGGNAVGHVLNAATRADQVDEAADQFDVPMLGVVPNDGAEIADQPVVHTSPESDVAEAYRALTDTLDEVIFEGAAADEAEMAFVEGWVEGDLDDGDDLEAEDESGAFGLF